ncbi:hypothetical protein WHI96_07980 [Pseudonocardia tropica]|uniref:Collagen triple helix repeat (20 copies) n=1 Tax=Pseudonocardia tropica TaxID=681289 RepID=A0ABV1JSV1_9PSEU
MASSAQLRREASAAIVELKQFRRSQAVLAGVATVGFAALIVAALVLLNVSGRQDQGITQLNASLATVCERTDTAQVPGEVAQDCDRAQQGELPPVVQGITLRGAEGSAGDPGTPGRPKTNGTNGESPACLNEPGRCQGQDGEKGTDGQSPPCLSEPTACRGVMGNPGAPGMPPVGWTTEFPDGGRQTCARVADFDPAAPFYDCDYQGPSPAAEQPEPTQEPSMGTN